jgi:hypothetical protein
MSGQAIIAPLVAGGDTSVGTEVDEVDDVDDVNPGTGSGGVPGAGVGSGVGVGDGSGKVMVSMTAPESSSSCSVALTSYGPSPIDATDGSIWWARTATPPPGDIRSVNPSANVTWTLATSGPTDTAIHQTGVPSTTPKAPEVAASGSVAALVPVAVVVSVPGASNKTPWPTAVSFDSSTDTTGVTEEPAPSPCVPDEADPDDDPDGGEPTGIGPHVQGCVEERR